MKLIWDSSCCCIYMLQAVDPVIIGLSYCMFIVSHISMHIMHAEFSVTFVC